MYNMNNSRRLEKNFHAWLFVIIQINKRQIYLCIFIFRYLLEKNSNKVNNKRVGK